MNVISYRELMKKIFDKDENGRFKPFHIEWMKCNLGKKTAGEIVEAKAVVVAGNRNDTTTSIATDKASEENKPKRQSNHHRNKTLNIRLLIAGNESNQIIKIHPLLILKFNNKEVVL